MYKGWASGRESIVQENRPISTSACSAFQLHGAGLPRGGWRMVNRIVRFFLEALLTAIRFSPAALISGLIKRSSRSCVRVSPGRLQGETAASIFLLYFLPSFFFLITPKDKLDVSECIGGTNSRLVNCPAISTANLPRKPREIHLGYPVYSRRHFFERISPNYDESFSRPRRGRKKYRAGNSVDDTLRSPRPRIMYQG